MRLAIRAVHDVRKSPTLVLVTVGRLFLVPLIVVSIGAGDRVFTAVALTAFVVADYFDGVVARRRTGDGPTRRAIDSISDRLAIWAVYLTMTIVGYLPLVLFLVLLARDIYCALQVCRLMRSRYVAIGADWPYRVLNGLLALWVIFAPRLPGGVRAAAFVGLLTLGAFVMMDLRRAVRQILAAPGYVSGIVVPAGDLRKRNLTFRPVELQNETVGSRTVT